jgi:hypothetical protein
MLQAAYNDLATDMDAKLYSSSVNIEHASLYGAASLLIANYLDLSDLKLKFNS